MPSPRAFFLVCLSLLIGSLALPRIHNYPLPDPSHEPLMSSVKRQLAPDLQACGFLGNSELYGLGIRLGFYLQLLASYIANQFSIDDDTSALLYTNSTFMAAIFIAAVVSSTTEHTYSAEIFIILYIFFGTLWASISAYSKTNIVSGGGTYVRIGLVTAMSGYCVWFWYRGVHLLSHDNCGTYIFLFTKLRVEGGALTFFKIVYTINFLLLAIISTPVLFSTIAFFSFPFVIIGRWAFCELYQKPKSTFKEACMEFRSNPRYWPIILDMLWVIMDSLELTENDPEIDVMKQTNEKKLEKEKESFLSRINSAGDSAIDLFARTIAGWKKRGITKYLHLLELLLIIYTILAVELTIRWNHIDGVYSLSATGQLIPLIIGGAGLWLVVLHIITRYVKNSHKRLETLACSEGKCCY